MEGRTDGRTEGERVRWEKGSGEDSKGGREGRRDRETEGHVDGVEERGRVGGREVQMCVGW